MAIVELDNAGLEIAGGIAGGISGGIAGGASGGAPLLSVRITAKFHEDRPVLHHIAFDLRAGEVLAVMGPSGCGKTSLLRILAGLDGAYDGEVRWAGRIAARRHEEGFPRIGTVFQEPLLFPWRSLRQNVTLAMPISDPGRADDYLGMLGLGDAADLLPGRVSLGMARRASIARALAVQPDILLLDEPFASLDQESARKSMAALREAWRPGRVATLLVTHDPEDAAQLADRILTLGGRPATIVRDVVIPHQARSGRQSA